MSSENLERWLTHIEGALKRADELLEEDEERYIPEIRGYQKDIRESKVKLEYKFKKQL